MNKKIFYSQEKESTMETLDALLYLKKLEKQGYAIKDMRYGIDINDYYENVNAFLQGVARLLIDEKVEVDTLYYSYSEDEELGRDPTSVFKMLQDAFFEGMVLRIYVPFLEGVNDDILNAFAGFIEKEADGIGMYWAEEMIEPAQIRYIINQIKEIKEAAALCV